MEINEGTLFKRGIPFDLQPSELSNYSVFCLNFLSRVYARTDKIEDILPLALI